MLFTMGCVTQRLISCLTAAVVLLTSVTCVCVGAPFSSATAGCHERRELAADKQCCRQDRDHGDHDHDGHHHPPSPCKHDGTGDPDHSCNHCQGSLVANSPSVQQFNHLLDLSLHVPAFDTNGVNLFASVAPGTRHFIGDIPPPVGPPTLLSLGCALNI
jgi:hypothetical protein